MKALWAVAAIGLGLAGPVGSSYAQPYGGYDRGYERDRGYREDYGRDRGYREERRGGGYGFDEREYLRCNADVRRAVQRGQMESGLAHWRTFGQRERRPLSC
jgi:hypothetical protein